MVASAATALGLNQKSEDTPKRSGKAPHGNVWQEPCMSDLENSSARPRAVKLFAKWCFYDKHNASRSVRILRWWILLA